MFEILQFKITVLYLNIYFYLIYSCDEGDPLKKLLYIYNIIIIINSNIERFCCMIFCGKGDTIL